MQREYDIVIWGASGFTGKLVTDYMFENYSNSNLAWAVAGRSRSKIEEILQGRDVEIIIADAHNPTDLRALAKITRVILTTVGPYARYGSELVSACAELGTHYCDLAGEVHWMRNMIDAHEDTAKESGARIVHTCGFDCIPSDIGTYFMQKQMQSAHGVAASHIKYRVKAFEGGFSGGTVDSLMAMMESAQSDPGILTTIADPYALNNSYRGLDGPDNNWPYYDPDFKAWVGPFVMAAVNMRVVRRSNELLNQAYGHEFRYDEGTLTKGGVGGLLSAGTMALGTSAVISLAALAPFRKFLQKILPKPGEGPSEEAIRTGFFDVELIAKHPTDSTKDMRGNVKGDRDPGYGSTAKMLSECAVCLAQDELPVAGGVWTPASAMGDALLKRLPANAGVTFELQE